MTKMKRLEERNILLTKRFHCSTPRFPDIVADATNRYRVFQTSWDLEHQLSQEPFELEQICQMAKMCVSMRGTFY